jgi:hypothetical protein
MSSFDDASLSKQLSEWEQMQQTYDSTFFLNRRNNNIEKSNDNFYNGIWEYKQPPQEHKILLLGHGGSDIPAHRIRIPSNVRVVGTATCGMKAFQSKLANIEESFFVKELPPLGVGIVSETKQKVNEYYDEWGGNQIIVKQVGSSLTDYSIELLLWYEQTPGVITLHPSGTYFYHKTTDAYIIQTLTDRTITTDNIRIAFNSSIYPTVETVIKLFDQKESMLFDDFYELFKFSLKISDLIRINNTVKNKKPTLIIASSCRVFDYVSPATIRARLNSIGGNITRKRQKKIKKKTMHRKKTRMKKNHRRTQRYNV